MPDFHAAAVRHFRDADALATTGPVANSVQLWAYASECTIKALALKQGHCTLDARGKPTAGFAQHLNETHATRQDLLSLYNSFQQGPQALVGPANAFTTWVVSERYENGVAILSNFSTFQSDAQAFKMMIQNAIAQGMLP